MRRNYIVLVEWTDGEIADADELAVCAASPAKAIEVARAIVGFLGSTFHDGSEKQ